MVAGVGDGEGGLAQKVCELPAGRGFHDNPANGDSYFYGLP